MIKPLLSSNLFIMFMLNIGTLVSDGWMDGYYVLLLIGISYFLSRLLFKMI